MQIYKDIIQIRFCVAIFSLAVISEAQSGPQYGSDCTSCHVSQTIVSGSSWVATSDVLNHKTPVFTGETISAFSPYPNGINTPQQIMPDTQAQFMWYCTTAVNCQNGEELPDEAGFRYVFNWGMNYGGFLRPHAIAKIIADDYFAMYVNNIFVTEAWLDDLIPKGSPPYTPGTPVEVDFSKYLYAGLNQTIDIYACNGYPPSLPRPKGECPNPSLRDYQYVLFDASIWYDVPEPTTGSLLGIGLATLVLTGKRCKKERR